MIFLSWSRLGPIAPPDRLTGLFTVSYPTGPGTPNRLLFKSGL